MRARIFRRSRYRRRHIQRQQPFFQSVGGEADFAGGETSFFSAAPPAVQTKLTIGQPGDKYEREADAMADRVVSQNTTEVASSSAGPSIQAKCSECAKEEGIQMMPEEEPEVQTMPEEEPEVQTMPEEEEGAVQAKMINRSSGSTTPTTASPTLSAKLSSKNGGSTLPRTTKAMMSQAFGRDFSNVRVHTDAKAVQMNRQLKAKAFTHGSDIYFNQGQYDPSSTSGKRLLAHELTHVVQQGSAGLTIQKKEDPNAGQGCWTTQDVIDGRIDHHAQSAMMEMFSKGGKAAANASAILSAVKSGDIDGVYLPDQGVPAKRAQRAKSSWWTMIPEGALSTCFKGPEGSRPLIVFRKRIKDNRELTAQALSTAWENCELPSAPTKCYVETIKKPKKKEKPVEPDLGCQTDQDCIDRGDGDWCMPPADVGFKRMCRWKKKPEPCSGPGECDPSDPRVKLKEHVTGEKCIPPDPGERCGYWGRKGPERKDCFDKAKKERNEEIQECENQYIRDVIESVPECAKLGAACLEGDLKSCLEFAAEDCHYNPAWQDLEDCRKVAHQKWFKKNKECDKIYLPPKRGPIA